MSDPGEFEPVDEIQARVIRGRALAYSESDT
jgi:hypothetical protein